eukprot:COSAG01_NODE_14615_length_1431_cov_1.192048_2_plen_315_part_00
MSHLDMYDLDDRNRMEPNALFMMIMTIMTLRRPALQILGVLTAVIGDTPHDMATTVEIPDKWVVATINGDGFKDEITGPRKQRQLRSLTTDWHQSTGRRKANVVFIQEVATKGDRDSPENWTRWKQHFINNVCPGGEGYITKETATIFYNAGTAKRTSTSYLSGRLLVTIMPVQHNRYVWINNYGPGTDNDDAKGKNQRSQHYDNVHKILKAIIKTEDTVIWGGDQNVILDPILDTTHENKGKTIPGRRALGDIMTAFSLVDPLMASQATRVKYEHHGKRGDMTWQRRGQPTAKRLDYFLLSPPAILFGRDDTK